MCDWRLFSRPSVAMPAGGADLFGAPQCACQSAGHHTHTHTRSVQDVPQERRERGARTAPSNLNHPSYWHGLRGARPGNTTGQQAATHTRMPDQSTPCQLHMFTLASVTHSKVCMRVYYWLWRSILTSPWFSVWCSNATCTSYSPKYAVLRNALTRC